jgi:hypothetical protein
MRQLIDDPALRQKLGAQAALVAQQEYAQGPIKKMEQLYDSLL